MRCARSALHCGSPRNPRKPEKDSPKMHPGRSNEEGFPGNQPGRNPSCVRARRRASTAWPDVPQERDDTKRLVTSLRMTAYRGRTEATMRCARSALHCGSPRNPRTPKRGSPKMHPGRSNEEGFFDCMTGRPARAGRYKTSGHFAQNDGIPGSHQGNDEMRSQHPASQQSEEPEKAGGGFPENASGAVKRRGILRLRDRTSRKSGTMQNVRSLRSE